LSLFRSQRLLGLASGLCALAAAVLIVVGLTGSRGGSSTKAPSAEFTGTRPTELQTFFEDDVRIQEDPAAALAMFRRMGVDRIRVFLRWGLIYGRQAIAPNPLSRTRPSFNAADPAAYSASGWAKYDEILRDAAAQGVGVYLTVGPPAPLWATGSGEPAGGPLGNWRPSAEDFGQFMRAVGTRYSGNYPDPLHPGKKLPRVTYWSIWNEPNYGPDLAPQAVDHSALEVSPMLYRGLVDAAWAALAATGHDHDTIVIGELSPLGQTLGDHPGDFGGMVPLRFLRALYCVDSSHRPLSGSAAAARGCPTTAAGSAAFPRDHPALFKATAFSDHTYTGGAAPNVTTPDEPDFADFPAISRLESTLDQLQSVYGSSTRFSIYDTEFGYLTTPPERNFRAISPATAAEYLNWAEYLSWRDPRILSYDQYLLSDPIGGNFPNGLEFADGTPKPSFFAFRMPIYLPITSAQPGAALEVWGCVRPARYARRTTGAEQRVKIQFRPSSGGAFATLRDLTLTDPHGYFDIRQQFHTSGSVRLAWSYPGGPEIFSRTVHVTVG
jgi:hypothetical protein